MTDKEWLLQRMPKATENEIESFEERIAIVLESYKNYTDTQELIARGNALSDLKKRHGDL